MRYLPFDVGLNIILYYNKLFRQKVYIYFHIISSSTQAEKVKELYQETAWWQGPEDDAGGGELHLHQAHSGGGDAQTEAGWQEGRSVSGPCHHRL